MIGNIKSKKTKVDFWTLEEFQKVISLLYKGDYYNYKSSPISGNRMDTGRNHSLLHAPWSFYLLNKEIRQP